MNLHTTWSIRQGELYLLVWPVWPKAAISPQKNVVIATPVVITVSVVIRNSTSGIHHHHHHGHICSHHHQSSSLSWPSSAQLSSPNPSLLTLPSPLHPYFHPQLPLLIKCIWSHQSGPSAHSSPNRHPGFFTKHYFTFMFEYHWWDSISCRLWFCVVLQPGEFFFFCHYQFRQVPLWQSKSKEGN